MAQNERKVNKTDNEAAVVEVQFVERAVASDSRGPEFESSHRQN